MTPPQYLDQYLANFIVSVRTKDNKEYEPSSLRGMIGSFDRHPNKRKYEHKYWVHHGVYENKGCPQS